MLNEGEEAALKCYENVGFTKACAAAWLYDTTNTRDSCLSTCRDFLGKPPNLDEQSCPLNDCILCDEVNSGVIFKMMAGRTRRGSGLLSFIIRPCSELVFDVAPLDPCPAGYWKTEEEDNTSAAFTKRIGSLLAGPVAMTLVAMLCLWG